jgi:hypothetical protein
VTLRLIAFAGIALALLKAYEVGRDRERARVLRAMDNALGPTPLGGDARRCPGSPRPQGSLAQVQWLKPRTKTLPSRGPGMHTGTSRLSAGLGAFPRARRLGWWRRSVRLTSADGAATSAPNAGPGPSRGRE